MRFLFQLTVVLFIAASALLSANALGGGGKGPVTGGWEPIKDLNDPYVKEIADFAVTEHNKQANKRLKLDSIKDGQSQVVAGTKYRLVIAAADGTATKRYEAVVWDKPWAHYRNLNSFNPV